MTCIFIAGQKRWYNSPGLSETEGFDSQIDTKSSDGGEQFDIENIAMVSARPSNVEAYSPPALP